MTSRLHAAALAWLAPTQQFVLQYRRQLLASLGLVLLGSGATAFAIANLAPDVALQPVQQVLEAIATEPTVLAQQAQDLAAHHYSLVRSDSTRSTDTADTLLRRLGLDDPAAAAFLRSDALAAKSLLGRAGRSVSVEASDGNRLLKLVARWSADDDKNFQRLVLEKTDQGFSSRLEQAAWVSAPRIASGTVRSSLFAATDEARIPDKVAVQLAEIFSGDIDFHRALRKGDRFSVVYESLEADGEPLRAGRVLSAEFVNAGKSYQALWFQEPGKAADGSAVARGGYYTADGNSLRRAFLASPLEFSRVTSGFKMRLHPILNQWRAHTGVDYAASMGTPVRSVGDGVVSFAGRQGGYGNVVQIQHNASQSTLYAHLSKILVRQGQRVGQSDKIALSGATGWATGPHLHFEFRVNGVFKDPLTLARQSEAQPVSAAARPAFERMAALANIQLQAAGTLQQASAQ